VTEGEAVAVTEGEAVAVTEGESWREKKRERGRKPIVSEIKRVIL
jgi:hypothetical protein